jgi:hypothetical protein
VTLPDTLVAALRTYLQEHRGDDQAKTLLFQLDALIMKDAEEKRLRNLQRLNP